MIFAVQVNAATNEVRNLSNVSPVNEELKAAFDELNYALTVEWDQKDEGFRAEQEQNFANTINSLKSEGLTDREVLNFTKSQIKDANIAKDLNDALAVVEMNKMTGSEANQYIAEAMKKSYSTGASWTSRNGGVGMRFILAGAFVYFFFIAKIMCNDIPSLGGAPAYQHCWTVYDYMSPTKN